MLCKQLVLDKFKFCFLKLWNFTFFKYFDPQLIESMGAECVHTEAWVCVCVCVCVWNSGNSLVDL